MRPNESATHTLNTNHTVGMCVDAVENFDDGCGSARIFSRLSDVAMRWRRQGFAARFCVCLEYCSSHAGTHEILGLTHTQIELNAYGIWWKIQVEISIEISSDAQCLKIRCRFAGSVPTSSSRWVTNLDKNKSWIRFAPINICVYKPMYNKYFPVLIRLHLFSLSNTTIRNWFAEFRRCRILINSAEHSKHSKKVVTPEITNNKIVKNVQLASIREIT